MMNKFMKLAYDEAMRTSQLGLGGPFGCCITKDNKVVAVASNTVLKDNDPTAHGEINAIRKACKSLNTYDLSGCELYTTSAPCPMCLSAIMWAKIENLYYGCTCKDAEQIGFRDEPMYEYIMTSNTDTNEIKLCLQELDRNECLEIFDAYAKNNKIIY